MQVYVRLGIRLLYKVRLYPWTLPGGSLLMQGARGRMEGNRARRLLRSMTTKQGMKYDSPDSTRDIQPFIDFHKLNVDEILEPLESFSASRRFISVFADFLTPCPHQRHSTSSFIGVQPFQHTVVED